MAYAIHDNIRINPVKNSRSASKYLLRDKDLKKHYENLNKQVQSFQWGSNLNRFRSHQKFLNGRRLDDTNLEEFLNEYKTHYVNIHNSQIDNLGRKKTLRKDAVLFTEIDTTFKIDDLPIRFTERDNFKQNGEILKAFKEWEDAQVNLMLEQFGEDNVIGWVTHWDQTNPHIHFIVSNFDHKSQSFNSKKITGLPVVRALHDRNKTILKDLCNRNSLLAANFPGIKFLDSQTKEELKKSRGFGPTHNLKKFKDKTNWTEALKQYQEIRAVGEICDRTTEIGKKWADLKLTIVYENRDLIGITEGDLDINYNTGQIDNLDDYFNKVGDALREKAEEDENDNGRTW